MQVIGGVILHEGQIAEMRTGEGKTPCRRLPAYLNALSRERRSRGHRERLFGEERAGVDWPDSQVFRSFRRVDSMNMSEQERRSGYSKDVTYVTNSELGFDYLRDNLAQVPEDLVLREFNFCIIDEVDSILIDEARTPLIISGVADKPSERYVQAAKIADAFSKERALHRGREAKKRTIDRGRLRSRGRFVGRGRFVRSENAVALYIINATKRKELQLEVTNYIVRGQEIIIVDEFTGRTMQGRRWSDGLHQAVEAKEGVTIRNETVTIASVTYQAFFRTFPKLGGMTAYETELTEFDKIYDLSVQVVPTNRSVSREDATDVVFWIGKWEMERREKRDRENAQERTTGACRHDVRGNAPKRLLVCWMKTTSRTNC